MKGLIETARSGWVSIVIILILTLILVPENKAEDLLPNSSSQTSSPSQSPDDPYQSIRVLQSTEPFQIIFIDKASQTLDVLEYKNGSFTKIASYICATGENGGRKVKSGDSKTPEGIYFIIKRFTDNKITIFGKRAFHLDYPNAFDKSEGRNGDGIYIHGTNKKLIPNSTNGCITLRNQDLDLLAKFLIEHKTPIIIVNDKNELRQSATELSGIGRDRILSLLLPEEISKHEVIVQTLLVISDGAQNVAVGKFMVANNNCSSMTTFSRGYLNKNESGDWLISERVFRVSPMMIKPTRKKIQIARAVNKVQGPEKQEKTSITSDQRNNKGIVSFIEKWRLAWQGKQLDAYIDCYAENFRQGRKDLRAWRKYKKRLNRKYQTISVAVDDIKIDWQKNGAKVQFHQVYKSDKYFADGNKLLYLTYSEKGWQITREIWLN